MTDIQSDTRNGAPATTLEQRSAVQTIPANGSAGPATANGTANGTTGRDVVLAGGSGGGAVHNGTTPTGGSGGPGGAGGSAGAPRHDPKVVIALRNFAMSITVFNIIGYAYLGFEQPWLWPFIAIATGYTTEIVLEMIGARVEGRAPRFLGNGAKGLREFLYPAHITALALNMLTYVNDRVLVMVFGVILAVGAKWVLRAPVKGRLRHFMNPSNLGITAILLLFSWSSIAPPYHFEENLHGAWDWVLPAIILTAGTILNAKLTGRSWLIMAWVGTFALQAIVRGWLFHTSIPGALAMMTGTAFVLFTNYMITDPGTTPSKKPAQIFFGSGVALVYACFMAAHVAYGIFFATCLVCLIRGGFHWTLYFIDRSRAEQQLPAAEPTRATEPQPVLVTATDLQKGPEQVVPA